MLVRKRKLQEKLRDLLKANPEVFHYILENICGTFEPSYEEMVHGGMASMKIAHNEGRKEVGRELLRIAHMSNREMLSLREEEVMKDHHERDEGFIHDD